MKEERHHCTMTALGQLIVVSDELMAGIERFVCALYGKPNLASVNQLWYTMFCTKGNTTDRLPPCHDALRLHAMRSNYQAAVWRHALEPQPDIPPPAGHGWKAADGGGLSIHWLIGLPAPQQLLELVSCGCRTGCTSGRCNFHSNKMSCTDICKCTNCSNRPDNESDADEGDGDCGQDSD